MERVDRGRSRARRAGGRARARWPRARRGDAAHELHDGACGEPRQLPDQRMEGAGPFDPQDVGGLEEVADDRGRGPAELGHARATRGPGVARATMAPRIPWRRASSSPRSRSRSGRGIDVDPDDPVAARLVQHPRDLEPGDPQLRRDLALGSAVEVVATTGESTVLDEVQPGCGCVALEDHVGSLGRDHSSVDRSFEREGSRAALVSLGLGRLDQIAASWVAVAPSNRVSQDGAAAA